MFAGLDLVDPKELESMRHQLEDAHRWNTSLHARLGAIQNRGGGVGGAKDSGEGRLTHDCLLKFSHTSSNVHFDFTVLTGDSLSFIGDQTSYMSICVGEGHDDSLSLLSAPELRQKVSHELQVKCKSPASVLIAIIKGHAVHEAERSCFESQVLELQDCVSRLQDQLSQAQESDLSPRERNDKDAAVRSAWKQVGSHNKQS